MIPLAVFAIVPAGRVDCRRLPVADGGMASLRCVTSGLFAAVVGPSLPGGLRGRSREELAPLLLAHHRVVEAVMVMAPVLPVQFGTVVDGDPAVRRLLEEGRPLFRQAFAELAHRVEMELHVRWNFDDVLREVADTGAIMAQRAGVAAHGEGDTAARLALGQAVAQEIERRRGRLCRRIIDTLGPLAADVLVSPAAEPDTVVDLTLLIDRDAGDPLDARLEALDGEFSGRLHFRLVGPLPPYSFATVQARFPAFGEVERACGALGLGERATVADLKAAYRRRMRDCHPDAAATPADGRSQAVAEVSEAYRLLCALFSAGDAAGGGGGGVMPMHRLDRTSMEGLVLVSLSRREGAPWRGEEAA